MSIDHFSSSTLISFYITGGNMQHSATVKTTSITTIKSTLALVFVASLGLSLIASVGFAQGKGNIVHNAAHDTRHAASFPCH